jgi:hypothetical protein
MRLRHTAATGLALSLAVGFAIAAPGPLTIDTARISIAGTSNVHAWTASTSDVRITDVRLAVPLTGPNAWDAIAEPGAVEAFAIAVPAASLTSPKDGLDKNMHKALKVKEHADITFRLTRFEPVAEGTFQAAGILAVAGVEKEIAFSVNVERTGTTLSIRGKVPIVMTEFGIEPPKAMLGMLRTDPKVTVQFETVLAIPLT